MTSPPTPKERLLADILDELRRNSALLERLLETQKPVAPAPYAPWPQPWQPYMPQVSTTWGSGSTCDSHGAHRGPAGEYRVGWQTPPHGYMHGGWVHK